MSNTIIIGESNLTSTLTLGSTGTTTTLKGTTVAVAGTLTSSTYNSTSDITPMTIASNLTSVDCTIAGAQTSGALNIGNGTRNGPGGIKIGNGSNSANNIIIGGGLNSSGSINIGQVGGVTGTTTTNINTSTVGNHPVNIGSSSSLTTIAGTLNTPSVAPLLATSNLILGATQTTGILNIGTETRTGTGATGAINIGTGASSTNNINIGGGASSSGTINIGQVGAVTGTTTTNINTSTVGNHPVNIGSSSTTTTLGGIVNTSIGTIAGKTAYLEYDTGNASLSRTINCSTLNLNALILFFSGNAPLGTYTLTNIQENQIIILKNWNTNDTPIQFSIDQNSPLPIYLYAYGIDNTSGINTTTTFSLERGDAITLQKTSGKIYQFASGKNFPRGILSTNVEPISSSSQLDIGATQTTGILNIGTNVRTGTGAINIGNISNTSTSTINIGGKNDSAVNGAQSGSTVNINGANLWSNTTGTTSFRSSGTISLASYSGSAINIGAESGNYNDVNIGNYGTNANSRYTQIKTQNIYLGTTAADSRTVLGNGSNSNTGDFQGTVNIQKLQVGNNIAGQGSGVGNGTPFRCVIIERNVGSTSLAKGTITIPNAPTGAGFPMVFASINTNPDSTINPYFINVYPSSNTQFKYNKRFYNGTTVADATAETFNYIAVWF